MICHIVMFKFKEFAEGRSKAENLAEAKRRMLALREEIPEIVSMEAVSYTHLFWWKNRKIPRNSSG